jgi:carbon storage regulator
MLVLTRKQGEKIRIGDDVVITVVRTKGKAVRLGIQAPAHIPVLRGEIAASIAGDNHRSNHAGEKQEDGETDGESGPVRVISLQCSASSPTVQSLRGPLRAMVDAR